MPNQSRPKVKKSRALGIALTPEGRQVLRGPPLPAGRARPWPQAEHGLQGPSAGEAASARPVRHQRAPDGARLRPRPKAEGKTGEALVVELERRLDALVLRSGIARTIYQARQMVVHGHIEVNGGKVDKPSFRVRPDDVVMVRERSRDKVPFQVAREGGYAADGETPRYLQVNLKALAFRLDRDPNRKEIPVICDEQLVVEYYAR